MVRYKKCNKRNGNFTSKPSISQEEYNNLGCLEQERYIAIDEG